MKKEIIKSVIYEYNLDLNAFGLMGDNLFLTYLIIRKIAELSKLVGLILLVTSQITLNTYIYLLLFCIVLSIILDIIKGVYRAIYKNAEKKQF
jgi:hypothetical protein